MYNSFPDIGGMIKALFIAVAISIPFVIYGVVSFVIWLAHHVSFSWS